MKFFDRILTIIVTATLTSAVWIVFGSTFFAAAERDSAGADAAPDADAPASTSPAPVGPAAEPEPKAAATPEPAPTLAPTPAQSPVKTALAMPVAGVAVRDLVDSFLDPRGENDPRRHEAIDIMAPRGTAVLAAAPGVVAKLHRSKAGGRTVYVRSRDGEYLYLYAHLDAYADGLKEGERVARGAPLGEVGSSGNASPDAPHLHFAVLRTTADAEWWEPANAVNPYPLLTEPLEAEPAR